MALKPSVRARLLVALQGGTTMALVAFTPVGGPAQLALAVFVATLWAWAWRRLTRQAPRRLRLDRSRAIQVEDAQGRMRSGLVRDGSFVAPWLTIVRWRPEGAWFDRTVLVLPDALDGNTFRALRVLLRWM